MSETLTRGELTDVIFDETYSRYLADVAVAHFQLRIGGVLRLNQGAEPRLSFNIMPAHPLFEDDILSRSKPDWQDWKRVLLHHESYSRISKSMEETIGSPCHASGYLNGEWFLLTAMDADIKYGTDFFWVHLDGDYEVSEDGQYIEKLMKLSREIAPEFHEGRDIPIRSEQKEGKWKSFLKKTRRG